MTIKMYNKNIKIFKIKIRINSNKEQILKVVRMNDLTILNKYIFIYIHIHLNIIIN